MQNLTGWLPLGVGNFSDFAYFGPGAVRDGYVVRGYGNLFISVGYWYAHGMAVRPVVVLKSDITTDEVAKSENQSEQEVDWEYTNSLVVNEGAIDKGVVLVEESKE